MKANRRTKRAARQLYRICLVAGGLDAGRVRFVAGRLVESRRRGALAILSSFARLVRLDRDRHAALVESAAPVPEDVRELLRKRLMRAYGNVTPAFAENAALIGGLRIKVGSHVYDGSVRAKLAALQSRL